MTAWIRACVVAAALLSMVATADAQDRSFDLQLYAPPIAGGTTLNLDRTTIPRHLAVVVGLATSYAYGPFVRSNSDGTSLAIMPHLSQTEAMVAVGFFELLEVGAAMPFSIAPDVANDPVSMAPGRHFGVGPGDLRLTLKVPVLRGDFALSARGVFTLPTGDDGDYLGQRAWSAMPSVLLGGTLGALRVGGEIGYRLRERSSIGNFEQDDEIQLIAGASYEFTPEWSALLDWQWRIGAGGRSLTAAENPMDVNAGARWIPTRGVSLEMGVGTGILSGYGAPPFRGILALRYTTEQEPCAAGPEDFDGFDDGDFCADPDNDGDGWPDTGDECPNDREDPDGFLDDGCPELDNDADGVRDDTDRCPNESEDRDGFQDDDGCPEPDNDEDGVSDGADDCAMEPEDRDDFQDDDGCPEPGPMQATVTVTDTRILISERIYFDFDMDTIRSVSQPLLDQVAEVVQALPASRHIRVEGYSDSDGDERYNVDLSYRRARAVTEYLASRGVPRERLEYNGYGPRNPVAPNDTPEGRALNRRVEFTILDTGQPQPAPQQPQVNPQGAQPDPGAPPGETERERRRRERRERRQQRQQGGGE